MIQTILYSLLGLFAVYVAYMIVKPLSELILLKLKHGKDIHIEYFPILGDIFFIKQRAITIYHDNNYYRRKAIQDNPEIKVKFSLNKSLLRTILFWIR